MRKRLFALLLMLTVFAGPAFGQTDEPVRVTQGDIAFAFDPEIALTAAVARLPLAPLNANTPPGDEYPAHTLFTLIGYALGEDIAPAAAPTLAIYQVADFEAAGWGDELAALRDLLVERPDLTRQVGLPYLPQSAAPQVFTTRADYLQFASGSGVRYLTAFAFDVAPLLEGQIIYTFQGLTADETRYVAATFPLNTGALPAELPEDFDLAAFTDRLDTYFADLLAGLIDPEAAFTPDLDALDALIDSLQVGDAAPRDEVAGVSTAAPAPQTPAAVEVVSPTATIDATLAPTFTAVPTLSPFFEVAYSRFAFNMPYVLASDFAYAVVPGAAANPATPPGDEFPSHVNFSFSTYGVTGPRPAALNFYLIEDDPAQFGFDGVVINLSTLLRDRPDLAAQTELPFPPLFDAEQRVQGQPAYLDFASGSGVRYLTIYVTQDAPPVEGSVFYTFQGITADERYLVSALFPVDTGLLQAEIANFDINNFNPSSDGFYTDLEARLNEGVDLTPPLRALDELIASISVAE
jgi:hypothetical protein